jgi:antitoxin component YwqK of YwqJK toxin-antitoxin module
MPAPLKWTIGIITPIILILCLLSFGNPQWKYCFMWQAYVWPKHDGGRIFPPESYSGVWREWYSSGDLSKESEIENGMIHGYDKLFWKGQVTFLGHERNGVPHGLQQSFFDNGKIKTEDTITNGRHDGYSREYYKNGQLWYEFKYDFGVKKVTRFYFENGQLESRTFHHNKGVPAKSIEIHSYAKGLNHGLAVAQLTHEYNNEGKLVRIDNTNKNGEVVDIYDIEEEIDRRQEFKEKIAAFEAELAQWEKEPK